MIRINEYLDDEIYVDEYGILSADAYAEAQLKQRLYGFKMHSSMTDVTIMFVDKNKNHLKNCKDDILEMFLDGDDDYINYCNRSGIKIVDDENGDLTYIRSGRDKVYVADIDGDFYCVEVIDSYEGRF